MAWQREAIIAMLAMHRQRATYGAVGGLLGRPAMGVMSGLPRDATHSWVVSAATGLPTGYRPSEMAAGLEGSTVLKTPDALLEWLQGRR